MQPEDFAEIEAAFTNVGRDEIWDRKIGDHLIKLSPIPFPAQGKVNDALANKELGNNVIIESKRVTLSYSIVGIDNINLIKYRDTGPMFIIKGRDGSNVKVTLDRYIYEKLNTWGGQYIDDVFEVYADLIESQQKSNLKEIKFENLKDPNLELLELEEKVADLRRQLGKPQLIEKTLDEPSKQEKDDEESLTDDEESQGFDPFRSVEEDQTTLSQPIPASKSVPVSIEPTTSISSRTKEIAESESGLTTTENPHVPSSTAIDDVIEARNSESQTLIIDSPIKQSVNPRFRRP